jgi:hypothetical protein
MELIISAPFMGFLFLENIAETAQPDGIRTSPSLNIGKPAFQNL